MNALTPRSKSLSLHPHYRYEGTERGLPAVTQHGRAELQLELESTPLAHTALLLRLSLPPTLWLPLAFPP